MTDAKPELLTIFTVAAALESEEERSNYLDEACVDPSARERVEALLRAHFEEGKFLGGPSPVRGPTIEAPSIEKPGAQIGPYTLREQIGEGGFGVVYVAEQTSPVRRKVALKIVKPGMDTKNVIARFEAERQALALMDHPNIARVLDAGASDSGRPYFVMELVQGVPITEFCDKNSLPAGRRLELFMDICHAVQHAHHKGIIHRDLKPNNVMVTLHDGKPVPKVIDFGVAKALSYQLTEKTIYTSYGQMIGTPAYMSPEQAEMSGLGIDTRSDIYSLGVLLYELLTGKTPLDAERLRVSGYNEMLRMIRDEEPPRPSAKVTTLGDEATVIAQNRQTDARKLHQHLAGELDWIVMKALDKDRHRRYDTANNFAADIKRFLCDEAVHACPPSRAYMLRKFIARHRGPLTAAAGLLLVLCLGLAGTSLGLFWARSAEDEAARERDRAIAARDAEAGERRRAEKSEAQSRRRLVRLTIANGMRHLNAGELLSSLPWFTEALSLDQTDAARAQLHRIRIRSALGQCPKLVWIWYHEGPVTFETMTLDLKLSTNAQFSPDGRYVVAPSGRISAGNWTARVWDATTGQVVRVFAHDRPVLHASYSDDGTMIATTSGDLGLRPGGFAQVWDARTGRQIIPPLEHQDAVLRASFSPDGSRIVTGSLDRTARVWNVRTGEPVTPPMEHAERVDAVSFSPDGQRVLTASNGWTIWDADTGQALTKLLSNGYPGMTHASFSPDGSRVVTAGMTARIWDTDSGRLQATLPHANNVWHATFSPDGRWVVTSSNDRTAQVWEAATGRRVGAPMNHPAGVAQTQFSPDSRHVVTASWDRTARVWEASTGRPITLPLKHGGDVMCAAFSPDGHRIVTASTDLLVRVWDLANLNGFSQSIRHSNLGNDEAFTAAFSPDGRNVVTAGTDQSARVWDASTREPVTGSLKHDGAVRHAAFSPDGHLLLTTSDDGTARIWNAATGRPRGAPLKHDRAVTHGSFSPDGGCVVTASDNAARVWNVRTGKPIATFQHSRRVRVAWFSPDGDRILSCSHDATARVWDAATAQPVTPPLKHNSTVEFSCFSGDGLRVLTTSNDGTARVWDANTGEPLGPPLWHGQSIWRGAFSPDGRRVATASNDNTVQVWDAVTGEPLTPPLGWQAGNPRDVSFSPDGRLIATAWGSGFAIVWDAITGEPLTGRLRHSYQGVDRAEFSPDGQRLLTASDEGTARLWNLLPDERPIEDLVLLAQVLCGHRIDATGASLVPFEPRALRDAWQSLRDKYPADFVPTPEDLVTWHREEADACERLGRWSDAIGHLQTAQQYSSDTSNLSRYRDTLASLKRLRAKAEEDSE